MGVGELANCYGAGSRLVRSEVEIREPCKEAKELEWSNAWLTMMMV
jgi:hypothetical protein